jgi:ABC-type multidrug transport system fused ATPase/permease subunit
MVNKDEIKHLWRTAPRGIILWNAFIISLLTLTAFISIEVFLVVQAIGSVIAMVIILQEDMSGKSDPKNFWTIMTLCGWIVFIFMSIVGIIQFTYKYTFGYLIEQDEIRKQKYSKENRSSELEQLRLDYNKRIETFKKLNDKIKNNQKLLGN